MAIANTEWAHGVKENLDEAATNIYAIVEALDNSFIPDEMAYDLLGGRDDAQEAVTRGFAQAFGVTYEVLSDRVIFDNVLASRESYSARMEDIDIALDAVLDGLYRMDEGIIWCHPDWEYPVDAYAEDAKRAVLNLRSLFGFDC